MSTANVTAGAIANATWYTDKAEIVTGSNSVTYNVYAVALPPTLTFQGTTTSNSNVISTTASMTLAIGATITGTGIAANTTITAQSLGASVTLSANATASGTNTFTVAPLAAGNIYSANPQIAANSRQQIYVGAGNKLTIIGANSTARELGTASSATAGVNANNT